MKLRTLLLVTYHFPPSAASGSFRLLGFARHLLSWGWRTVVVAPPRMPFEPVDDKLLGQVPAQTVVYAAPYPRGNRLTRRLMPFAVWAPACLRACARAIALEKPDALLTSSPPHMVHLLGRLVKARTRLPWIADYRDPWVYGLGKPRPRSLAALWEALKEKIVLRGADRIIVNTPLARDALAQDVPEFAGKMTVITNGFDPENFPAANVSEEKRSTLCLLHTGELYTGRDPRPLFDALVGLNLPRASNPLEVTFLGQSSDPRNDWAAEIRRRNLDKIVRFAGQVSYHEALTQMQAADILLLLDNPGRRVGIPAKLFEYFGARRPILALTNPHGDAGWALRQSGVRHRIALPDNPEQIRQALVELLQEITSQAPGSTQPLSNEFTRAHMAGQLGHILDQQVTSQGSGVRQNGILVE